MKSDLQISYIYTISRIILMNTPGLGSFELVLVNLARSSQSIQKTRSKPANCGN